tara:strand:- start:311 stop:490 length:180 start_codon:yes stop_codon:yes gene_type:complete
MKIFKKFFTKNNTHIREVAEKELRDNFSVLKSLQDYDQGKKEISTDNVADRMRDLQTTQ